jgi:hypothetical protein
VATIIGVLLASAQVRTLLALTTLAATLAALVQGLRGRAWGPVTGLVASTGVVIAVTLYSFNVPGLGGGRFAGCWSAFDAHEVLVAAFLTAGGIANIVLFAPMGFFLTLVLRRPLRAALLAFAASALIELTQGLFLGGHDCSGADLLSNTVGAMAGAAVASAPLVGARRLRRPPAAD